MSWTNAEKRKRDTMRYSLLDGAAWAAMTNAGISFLVPFAVALNAPILAIGALSSTPALLDGIGQRIGAEFTSIARKRLIVLAVAFQALLWILVALLALAPGSLVGPEMRITALVAVAAGIFFFGGLANPAWFSLMGDVVAEKERPLWFGYRMRVIYAAGIAALVLAGYFMDAASGSMAGFAALFFAAFLSRSASAVLLGLHYDPRPNATETGTPNQEIWDYAPVLFMIMFAVNMGAAYITVFMLSRLGFDYLSLALVNATPLVMYAISAPHWGRLMEKYGTKKVMVASTTLMSLAMLLWVFVTTPAQGIAASALGGFCMCGVLNSTFNYNYEIGGRRARLISMGHCALFSGIGAFAGIMAGGAMLAILGESTAAFQALFISTAVLRVGAGLAAHVRVREIKPGPGKRGTLGLMLRLITVYPFSGIAYDLSCLVPGKNAGNESRKHPKVVKT